MTDTVTRERPGDVNLTSGLWNRRRDLRAVRRHFGSSFGDDGDGSDVTISCATSNVVLCVGYTRVLLGDHGPYLELNPASVLWENLTKVAGGGDARFYDEWRVSPELVRGGVDDDVDVGVATETKTETNSDGQKDETIQLRRTAKLYHQIKPVTGQGNPPRDNSWAVANNRPTSEGYAGYEVGAVYVGAFEVSVGGRAMPQMGAAGSNTFSPKHNNPLCAGRVAWWRPKQGTGGIVPEGVCGVRNEPGNDAAKQGEIPVHAKDLAGTQTLVPGEGVWFTVVEHDDDDVSSSSRRAINVTGPGGEPVRSACPGYAEAAESAWKTAKRNSRAALLKKQGARTGSPAQQAAFRASVEPWSERREMERCAVASAMRRVGRILRENCARIVNEKNSNKDASNRKTNNTHGTEEELPKWLTAIVRGAVACAVLNSSSGDVALCARETAAACASVTYQNEKVTVVELTYTALREMRGKEFEVLQNGDDNAHAEATTDTEKERITSEARAAFDKALPSEEVGHDHLVAVLPVPQKSTSGLGHRVSLALRASPNVRAVVLVSSGPDTAVRDVVALAGACAHGTPPFVPVATTAVAPDGGEENKKPAVTLTLLERGDFGTAVGLAYSHGRVYCWQCGGDGHGKRQCPRRGGDESVGELTHAVTAMAV